MKNIAKRGRPSVFCDEYITQAYRYAMLGATDEQMAHFFGVNSNTLGKWKQKYPAFSHALKHGKTIADQAVMENLYKLANGYELVETRELEVNGLKQKETFTKKYPPSLGAIQFWLKNRMKQEWNERYRAEPMRHNEPEAAIESPKQEEMQRETIGKIYFITSDEQMDDYNSQKAGGLTDDSDQVIDCRQG